MAKTPSPSARSEQIVRKFFGEGHPNLQQAIATALEQAVAEERKRCVMLAEQRCEYLLLAPGKPCPEYGEACPARCIAESIRTPGGP